MCECPSMYNERQHRARKSHRCCECRREILAGEKYQVVSAIWEGEFHTYKTCAECVDTRAKASEGVDGHDCCDLPCFGDLYEYISEGLPDTRLLVDSMKKRIELGKDSSETA